MIRKGCDQLLREAQMLANRRYGLLAHGGSITSAGQPLHLALATSRAGPPEALFGPEHGFYGIEQDMVASGGGCDPWTGVPVISLYGDSADSLRPQPEAFAGLEVLVIDLQDVGCRYYTYAATAVWAAEVALAAGLEVWVLDRPNPLGGMVVEGGLPRPGYESFVGAFRIPVRHGLTLGELMRLECRRRGWSAEPRIFPVQGWRRDLEWSGPWIAPSPNMPTLATALVYPGGCLIEATELSEGRGTTRPFQLIGAPGLDPPALAVVLGRSMQELPGVTFVPTYFRPQFHKHRGEICGGVEVVVSDPRSFPAYRCGVELLAAIRGELGDHFAWRKDPYEFVGERPAIDLLTGDAELREALDAKNGPDRVRLEEWIDGWRDDERAFCEERRAILLYPEVS